MAPGTAPSPSSNARLVTMREVPAEMAANLRAAADRLLESFDDVQMHDIAEAAGVARSSLYYYFANKDDVLAFLLQSMLDDLVSATTDAVAGPGTPSERLLAVIRSQLEHLGQNSAASQQLIANLGRAGKLPDLAAKVREGFEVPVRELLAEGAADGTLSPIVDDELGATALFGALLMIGLKTLIVEGHIDIDRTMELIGPMFWNGIAQRQQE